jgi:hypothetical protein
MNKCINNKKQVGKGEMELKKTQKNNIIWITTVV